MFSISCGITSIILFYLYQYNANAGQLVGVPALLFFILLSIRFGFWFYSRVMRASRASAHQRSVAWIEFGYYLGMVLGLTIWKLLGIHLELGMALIIDAFFQFLAGILDFKGMILERHPVEQSKQNAPSIAPLQSTQCQSAWCWKLTGAVVFTTMGIQVVIFNTTHYVTEELSSYILATFYLGVAIAAFVCNKYKIYITWNSKNNLAMIVPHNTKKTVVFPLLFPMIISPLGSSPKFAVNSHLFSPSS